MGRNPLDHMNERIARLRRLKPSVVEGVEAHVASIECEVAEDAPRRRPRGRPATKVPPQAQKPAESALSNGFLHLDDQTPGHTGIESLAHAIGMSPTSLRQLEPLLERRPDGTFPTAPNRALLQALGYIAGRDDGLDVLDRMELRKRRAVCERMEFEYEVSKGKYILVADVEKQVGEACAVLRNELLGMERMALTWAGMDAPELALSIRRAVEAALTSFIGYALNGSPNESQPEEQDE